VSERRACKTIGADRSSVRYRATRPDDGAIRERLRALAAERRRFRILCIVDDYTRECIGLVADTSSSGSRVAQELDAIVKRRGRP
jgi:transposase InsO family protein